MILVCVAALGAAAGWAASAFMHSHKWYLVYVDAQTAHIRRLALSTTGSVSSRCSPTPMTWHLERAGLRPGRWYLVSLYNEPFYLIVENMTLSDFYYLSGKASCYAFRLETLAGREWSRIFCYECARIFRDYCLEREKAVLSADKQKTVLRGPIDKAHRRLDALYLGIWLLSALDGVRGFW